MQTVPCGELAWEDFEKLIERLVELDGDPADYVARYAGSGDDQEGIDVYSRSRESGRYTVYQCRRYSRLYPSDVRSAVSDFLAAKWATSADRTAERFVFCTSHTLETRGLTDEVNDQLDRLATHDPPFEFDAWGAEKLSKKLKAHPVVVADIFLTREGHRCNFG
jgi:Restriction endonuclease